MFVCMYVYVCMCVHMSMYMYICMYVHACMYMYVYLYVYMLGIYSVNNNSIVHPPSVFDLFVSFSFFSHYNNFYIYLHIDIFCCCSGRRVTMKLMSKYRPIAKYVNDIHVQRTPTHTPCVVCTCMSMSLYVYVCVCMYVCVCVCVCMCVCTCMCIVQCALF